MNKVTQGSNLVVMGSKAYVSSGPQLWVSTLLYNKGILSTNKIWDEYIRDKSLGPEMIPSRTFLKVRVLQCMLANGKVKKGRAADIPEYANGGWRLQQKKAFRNICPTVLG